MAGLLPHISLTNEQKLDIFESAISNTDMHA